MVVVDGRVHDLLTLFTVRQGKPSVGRLTMLALKFAIACEMFRACYTLRRTTCTFTFYYVISTTFIEISKHFIRGTNHCLVRYIYSIYTYIFLCTLI